MTVPDEEVFAFVDGELPPEAMARIEAAMATDPQLALRIETQRSLRRLLSGAHAGVVRGAPPKAGTSTLGAKAPPDAKPAEVIAFPGARAKAKAKAKPREPKPPRPAGAGSSRSMPVWAAMAACLVVGLFVGRMADPPPLTLSGADDPAPIAAGPLAKALGAQDSRQAVTGPVRIGLSFTSRSGAYCRTFQVFGRSSRAGVACRDPAAWRVLAVSPIDAGAAGSQTPPAVLAAVDAMIVGQPLDATGEAKARAAGWKPARALVQKGAAPR